MTTDDWNVDFFLRGFWVRGRVVVTGLFLSRLTVLCTVHALCVATLVRAIVLQVFLVAQECGFRLMAHACLSLNTHPTHVIAPGKFELDRS